MKKNALTDKAAGHIAAGILSMQRLFAQTLGKIAASWKTKQQWIFLYIVCLLFGGLSVIAIVKPFNRGSAVLNMPVTIRTPKMLPEEREARISDDEIKQLRAFKQSLDSTTKKKLLIRRPGLMDSLDMLEQIYDSQKK